LRDVDKPLGGAGGVGESVVDYLYTAGAHVFFGDINEDASRKLITQLKARRPGSTNSLVSILFDAREYEENIALFKLAYKAHGRVDHAFSIAAITENVNWYDEDLDLISIEVPPSTALVDVNLTGVLYFTRIAAVYLRQGNDKLTRDKSICLLGSIASFKQQAGLFVYGPTKHGIMGLFRNTRKLLYQKYRIRINMVNPSHVNTVMGSSVHQLWVDHGLPVNEAYHVAEYVMTLAAVPKKEPGEAATGLAVYVEGGKGWEIEEDLYKTDHIWMGKEMSHNSAKIDDALGTGVDWKPIEKPIRSKI
jgi:NAD(P)-dependent dehydrogenase (short-subunit alcohol dehydrogenase family)